LSTQEQAKPQIHESIEQTTGFCIAGLQKNDKAATSSKLLTYNTPKRKLLHISEFA
jgi:hypothetical protein